MTSPKYLTIEYLTPKEIQRIFSKIEFDTHTNCWNWTGAISHDGYGVFTYHSKYIRIHRLMFAWLKTPVPLGKKRGIPLIDHTVCNNRRCANPDHMSLTTNQENVLRGKGPTASNARKTHCKHGHLLPTTSNRPAGGRYCPTCSRVRSRDYQRKKRTTRQD